MFWDWLMVLLDSPCTAGARSTNIQIEWTMSSYVSAYARIRKIEKTVILTLFLPVKSHNHFLHFSPKIPLFSSKKGSPNQAMLVVKHINSDPVFRSLKIQGSNYRRTAAVKHPPDAARKNQLFSGERRTNEHQFFITAGWIERFAQ